MSVSALLVPVFFFFFSVHCAVILFFKVVAHYFEEGNVQLDAKHECNDSTIIQVERVLRGLNFILAFALLLFDYSFLLIFFL